MRRKLSILILILFVYLQAQTQDPTIGLLEIDHDHISEGYTLFCPWVSSDCFLINNCGEKVNTWNTGLPFDLTMAYIDDRGDLFVLNHDVLVKYDWNSNIIWEFLSSEYGLIAHHDFEIMPNGNILIIASENLDSEAATELGFGEIDSEEEIMIDGLYEFKHIENDSFSLVWKWSFKDHLVQEINDSINTFGIIKNTPRKLDVNFTALPDLSDWLHCNGVNYNEALDQVIISSRNTSEIYIVDHSTSIEEAASSTGGNHDFGGDFLWRWGFQNLTEQHDPNWIPEGHPNAGMVSVFNNIDSSSTNFFSSIKIIDPPVDAQGKYQIDTLNQFLPQEAYKIISGEEHEIFSPFMSGTHSQENGNFIICSGRFGDFYELTEDGKLVWKYHNPIFETPLTQFNPAMASFTFNIKKYSSTFIGFEGKDLIPKGLVENINPLSEQCSMNTDTNDPRELDLSIFPNPSTGRVYFEGEDLIMQVQIFALSGKKITTIFQPKSYVDVPFKAGSYILQFQYKDQVINKLVSIIK